MPDVPPQPKGMTYVIPVFPDAENPGQYVIAPGGGNGGIQLPASDYVAYTYYGSTNNIETATYKVGGSGGTTVATLTYTYVNGGAADDDNIASVTKS